MESQTVKARFGLLYRAARSLRVVLVLGGRDPQKAPSHFARLPGKSSADRLREFEYQTTRLEAQLAVLEQDTDGTQGKLSAAGRRIRMRSLELTRALLYDHLQTAKKLNRGTSTIVRLQDRLEAASRPNAPRVRIDGADLADATVDVDRLADLMFLFDEVRSRLDRPTRTATKKDGGREEGVA